MRDSRLLAGLARQLLLACGLLSLARANFLFVEEPLARYSPALGQDDLFGYATALHRIDDSGEPSDFTEAIDNTRIIVGAPSGTFPGGLSFPGINDSEVIDRTGLVYACPVTPGDCEAVTGSGNGNDIRLFDYKGNEFEVDSFDELVQSEQKEDQFMGATIISTGEHVMVCAPRWISLDTRDSLYGPFDKTRAHGRCFIAGRNITDFVLLRPCTTGTSQSLEGESYCMAGTSATIYDNQETSDKLSVFLGGPPYGESAGVVFQYDLLQNLMPTTSLPEYIPSELSDNQFQYGGMAVALGRISNIEEQDLVYSQPKSNFYSGRVQVYNLSRGAVIMDIDGEQMGEYFGWALTTADLNGDSFDEVIVGAPLYSTVDEIELGRVFIFRNNMGTLESNDPIVILGSEYKGRFGSAIVNLGDINSDGFEDIAISAPFVDHDGGAEGSVYVYLGSGSDTITKTPNEIITALQISKVLGFDSSNYLQSFGYSLSSGVDVDANFNNDLVIGGYKSQTIIVLRTYSIANITLSLATFPEKLLEYTEMDCEFESEMFACFELEITASYNGRGLDNRSLAVMLSVTENAVELGRIFFKDRADEYVEFLYFNTTDKDIKINVTVYVKNDIADIDRRTPLGMVVNVFSPDRPQRSVDGSQDLIDLRDIPLLNVMPQNDLEIDLSLEGCENPDQCMPDLELSLYDISYLDSNEEVVRVNDILVGKVRFVRVVLNYRTLTEDAVGTHLELTLPPSILAAPRSIASVGTADTLATSQCPNEMDNVYTCAVHPIFSSYDGVFQVELLLRVANSITGMEEDANLTISITTGRGNDPNSTNIDPNTTNNHLVIPLSVSAEASVEFQELLITPDTTQYEDTNEFITGTVIITRASLLNGGPSAIPSSQLSIYLPSQSEMTGEHYYLYPTMSTVSSGSITCNGTNPDNFDISQPEQRRRRRQRNSRSLGGDLERLYEYMVGGREEGGEKRLQKREDTQGVNCASEIELCAPVVCTISNFPAGSTATVSVFSVIDNRFFRTRSGDFALYAHATFEIASDFVDGENQSITSNKLLVQEPKKSTDNSIPPWVYIVSGVGALIVLALIILLLYCVGFFKLRRKDRIAKEREQMSSQVGPGGSAAVTKPGPAASLDSKPDKLDEEEDIDLDEKPPVTPPAKVEASEKQPIITDAETTL